MRHPESGPIVEVTQAAFDTLWSDKGWVEVPEDEARAILLAAANSDVIVDDEADLAAGAAAEPADALTGEQAADVASFDISTASYGSTTKATLEAVALARQIDASGTKPELWERLGGSAQS